MLSWNFSFQCLVPNMSNCKTRNDGKDSHVFLSVPEFAAEAERLQESDSVVGEVRVSVGRDRILAHPGELASSGLGILGWVYGELY
jgi:hypothetical protein